MGYNCFIRMWSLYRTIANNHIVIFQASILNGTMAVVAGIVAQLLEDNFGQIGPFQGAIALTVLALILVLGWEENYGESNEGDHSSSSLYTQFIDGWKATASDSRIWRIGFTQALSEGAMYTVSFFHVVFYCCFFYVSQRIFSCFIQ